MFKGSHTGVGTLIIVCQDPKTQLGSSQSIDYNYPQPSLPSSLKGICVDENEQGVPVCVCPNNALVTNVCISQKPDYLLECTKDETIDITVQWKRSDCKDISIGKDNAANKNVFVADYNPTTSTFTCKQSPAS